MSQNIAQFGKTETKQILGRKRQKLNIKWYDISKIKEINLCLLRQNSHDAYFTVYHINKAKYFFMAVKSGP
jgi:hypothetical protein